LNNPKLFEFLPTKMSIKGKVVFDQLPFYFIHHLV